MLLAGGKEFPILEVRTLKCAGSSKAAA